MSSPIFDSTFGTGRFKGVTTDQSQSDAQPAASELIEVADLSDVGLFPYQDQDEHKVVVYFNTGEAARRFGERLKETLRSRAADRGVHGELIPDCPTDGVAARQGNGG